MTMPTYEQFSAIAMDEGFDEILIREWEANLVLEPHQHPFDVSALVVRGSLQLTVGQQVRHLEAGDPFRLARNTLHQEIYGPQGATFWVARANQG